MISRRDRPRVLILSQFFDPEPTFKGIIFARELARLGHDVRVLTGFPNYPGGQIYAGYRQKLLRRETIEGIPVWRVPLYPSHDASAFRRALNYISFALTASLAALVVPRPDIVYVHHPPLSISAPALTLRWLRGVPFVYDVQDLWPDTLASTGMISRPAILRFIGRIALRVYRASTRIVVLSPGFARRLADRGVPAARLDVIPNWAHERNVVVSGPGGHSTFRGESPFTVTFAGNLGPAQGLDTVIEAARLLSHQSGIRFRIVGDGIDGKRLRAAAEGINSVEFIGRVPQVEVGAYLESSDALLVHLRDDPLFSVTIPSKIQAYLLAGQPILVGVRGDAADLVGEANAGICFEPENPRSLADAVETLANLSREDRARMGAAGRRYYDSQLSLAVGTAHFSRVLTEASWIRPWTQGVKRGLDLLLALLSLTILVLPMLVVALIVRFRLGSPVLFTQERTGKDGETFRILKFRSMTDARDAGGELLPPAERLTPLGIFLRLTSIDELPGLVNVLRGDMSLVGPRPLLTRYTPYFTSVELNRLRVRPGITGWAQVHGRNSVSWDERLALDVEYVQRHSIIFDIRIMITTAAMVLRRRGVAVDPEALMQNLDVERSGRGGGAA